MIVKRVLIIANPAAGSGRSGKIIKRARGLAAKHPACCAHDFRLTESAGHGLEIARAEGANFELVVALGGDGTVNETVQGLMQASNPDEPAVGAVGRPVFGLIPVGTGNDFARSAGIGRSLKAAFDRFCQGVPVFCDVGRVNGRYFINGLGIGFDGQANYESTLITGVRGTLRYLVAIVRTLGTWRAISMTLSVGDHPPVTQPTYLIAVGNGSSVGGGLKLTPNARLDDGTLHICHVGAITPFKVVRNFLRLKTGTLDKLNEVSMFSGPNIVITSDHPLPVHVDGEVLGLDLHRLEISVLPAALQVLGNFA